MPYSGDGIRLRSSARTSVGQVRENNEDSVHLWPGDLFVMAVVADGMGGAAAGEEASRLAIEAIQAGMSLRSQDGHEALGKLSDKDIGSRLRAAIEKANLSIINRAIEKPDMKGMGTTVTLAFARSRDVIIAHVGDSRAYLVDGGNSMITQITSDHSFVEALLAAGHITPEQADEHPMRNVLYRALGQAEDMDVDLYQSRLHVHDRLVLCSDGLTRHVKPEEIASLSLQYDNPDEASQALIDLANERGGEDNVSVIVVVVEQENMDEADTADVDMMFAAEEDEDDTLVLGKSLMNRGNPMPENRSDDMGTDTPMPDASLQPVKPLNKQKMHAERVSDTDEVPSVDQRETRTSAFEPAHSDTDPSPPPYEDNGEGHDTRPPEQ
jgi:protein phosphatase